MDLFVIRGGRRLAGRIAVGGSKNSTLPIMAASLMIDGPVTLSGVPDLADVTTLSLVLESLGMSVHRGNGRFDSETRGTGEPQDIPSPLTPLPRERGTGGDARIHHPQPEQLTKPSLRLEVRDETRCVAEYDLVRRMRASVCVLGPLIARRGRAVVSLPGGCNIGDRPINVHLRALAALGASIVVERGYVVATASRLRGADVDLAGPRGPTVTGTANVLAAAALAGGRSVLRHAAREPEIVDLAAFLNAAGARIAGAGTACIEVDGVERLRAVEHRVNTDRIEAATLMMATALTGGDVVLDGVPVAHLAVVVERLREAGVTIAAGDSEVEGIASLRVTSQRPLSPVDVVAAPYPEFPTDLQAQWTALMTAAEGTSRVRDDVFPDRFLHVPELARLGADVARTGSGVAIRGGRPLRGANVMASDLRASAALVMAALAAEGETVIRRIYHLDRGYERLDVRLATLGADVERRTDDSAIAVPPPV